MRLEVHRKSLSVLKLTLPVRVKKSARRRLLRPPIPMTFCFKHLGAFKADTSSDKNFYIEKSGVPSLLKWVEILPFFPKLAQSDCLELSTSMQLPFQTGEDNLLPMRI
jgi:hypothetical protein